MRELEDALVEVPNCFEQLERPHIPHLSVGYDLQSHRMEDPADIVIQLIKLMYFFPRSEVPEYAVRENELVGGVKGGSVLDILVRHAGFGREYFFLGLNVVDEALVHIRGNHFVLVQLTELHILLSVELHNLVKETLHLPEAGERTTPDAGSQEEISFRIRLDVVHFRVVAVVRPVFVPCADVEELDFSLVSSYNCPLIAGRKGSCCELIFFSWSQHPEKQ